MVEVLTNSMFKCWLVQRMCVVLLQNIYIAVAWLPRCKGEEITNKTLIRILYWSTIRSYADIV